MAASGSRILRRLAIFTVAAVALAGAVSAVTALQLPNTYKAVALLVVEPQPLEMQSFVPGVVSPQTAEGRRVSYASVRELEELPLPDYEKMFTSPEIAKQVRDRLREELKKKSLPEGNLTIEKVRNALEVESNIEVTVDDAVKYQQVLTMSFTTIDPQAAATVANYWVEIATALAGKLRGVGSANAVRALTDQLESTRRHIADARARKAGLAPDSAEYEDLAQEIKDLERHVSENVISLQDAELVAREIGARFNIASNAIPPETKSGPPRSLMVLVSMFLAGVAVPAVFFGLIALRAYADTLEAAPGARG